MKGIGQNVLLNARMLPTTTHIAVRWLNYYNGGTSTTTWVANAKVVEVDPTVVMNLANANSIVDDIAADGKLTPVEKKQLKLIWDNILKEKTTISATADSYGIATATKDAYNTAYTTLFNQVNPLLSNLNVTSDVVRATLNTNFATYYEKRTLITQAIDTAWVASGGSIDGGKIASDTVTTDQILLSSGNMIYGGLDNFSNYSSTPAGYGERGTTTLSQDYTLFGPNSLKHVSTDANSYYYIHPSSNTNSAWLKLDSNQQYILSAYVRTTSTTATSVNLAAVWREGATTSGGAAATGNLVLTASDSWKQVYIKFTASGTNPHLSYYIRNVNSGITTYWTGFMLEKVSASQTKPYQYQQGNITRIDGGNIVTNSIHASKIQADTLVVNGANIQDLTVDTIKIKDGAISQIYSRDTSTIHLYIGAGVSNDPNAVNLPDNYSGSRGICIVEHTGIGVENRIINGSRYFGTFMLSAGTWESYYTFQPIVNNKSTMIDVDPRFVDTRDSYQSRRTYVGSKIGAYNRGDGKYDLLLFIPEWSLGPQVFSFTVNVWDHVLGIGVPFQKTNTSLVEHIALGSSLTKTTAIIWRK